jgi:phosphonate transport system substrate-binding protein
VEQYGKPKLLARLAKDGKAGLKGMIILREESKIEKLSQLKGKRFAFGDANSTLGTQVPAALLADAGVELEQLGDYNYLKNHNNVALGVLMGKYDAGGVKEEVFIRYRERGLKTLTTTPIITSHAFVASYRLESDTFQQLQNLLLQLHKGPEGQKILDQIKRGTTQLIPASDADYDSLRHILHAGAIQ